MFAIKWDEPGEKVYELGLDRGVLYPPGSKGVPWNGLVSFDEDYEDGESEAIYFNGVKQFHLMVPGEFIGQIQAFTYPDEFIGLDGLENIEGISGVYADTQYRPNFGMSYRTKVGNDVDGNDSEYKIHLLYNLTAEPSSKTRDTLSDSIQANLFSWDVKSVPVALINKNPTAHFIVDSKCTYPETLENLENILYGTETTPGRLPTASELQAMSILIVTDLGDGTAEITGPDEYVYPAEFGVANYIFITEDSQYILTTEDYALTDDEQYIFISDDSTEDGVYEIVLPCIHEADAGAIVISSS